jgi:molybdenum cofactor cytidylyltransferase
VKTAAILLAAGKSKRFGASNKLMASFRGRPLIAHAAETLRDFAPDQLIAVVSNLDMASELDGFTCIPVNGVFAAQSASLRIGVEFARLAGADRVIIVLADMPFITKPMLRGLCVKCTANNGSVATDGYKRSPPACFPREYFGTLTNLQGDRGAGKLLWEIPDNALVSVKGCELADIDTVDDLIRYM